MSAEKDKSPTPETDAQLRTFDSLTKYGKRFTNRTGQVNADFARRLERQRDEAWAEIEGWRNKWKYAVDMAARAEIERDAWYQKWHARAVLVRDAREERDQWRECAENLIDYARECLGKLSSWGSGYAHCEREMDSIRKDIAEFERLKEGEK